MNYCSHCGSVVSLRVPDGDNRPRYGCDRCGRIHYQNPRIIAGCLAVHEERVLLCRRAIEPRLGRWTLPAGFMENGESLREAALRETLEEACARVQLESLYTISSIRHINQVQMLFLATLPTPNFAAGEETLEARLFEEADIPWEALAFSTISKALQLYFNDRRRGTFPLHHLDIDGELLQPR
ncbi:NUDIX hydrolase [Motiliproteus sp. SC1-56]|uniref:NUDIX hydrolase n=1 Tax=Motiliproteus sp. SC1-56 TaxID=2799565 RepID=UPI001A8FF817|nr:NUDIX hydrolase [Motiliproteus sp. SC1-56]